MSLDNKDESQPSPAAADGASGVGGRKPSVVKPPEQTLKCPRCDSPNTKFCYYNNYSLTQPRHFCKTCRRYWTKGGALRNVPIGGGCRKSRKTRSGSSRFSNNGDSSSKVASLDMGELSLFNGLTPPAMDYQLGGLNQFSSTPINPPPFMNLDSLGFNFPFVKQDLVQEIGITNDHLASSIESLSYMNQDLHRKLQQQRLAALFSGGATGGSDVGGCGGIIEQQSQTVMESQAQKLQPIFFENILDLPKTSHTTMAASDLRIDDQNGDLQTEWFFDGGYTSMNVDPTAGVPPTEGNNSGNYENGSVSNWNSGIQGSNQFNQYNAHP